MDQPLVVIVAVAGVAIFTAIQFVRIARHRRGIRESVEQYATRNGFQFSAADPYQLAGSDLPLLCRGGGQQCTNVVAGQWQGLRFAGADYRYREREGRGGHHYYKFHAMVVAWLDPRLQLPPMVITRRVVPATYGDHVGLRPLQVGWEPFDRRFQIEVAGGRLPGGVVHEAMLAYLLESLATTAAFRWEVSGSRLLVASAPRNQPTEDMLLENIQDLLTAAKGFADRLAPVGSWR
jgi:hypothetical protein